MIRYCSSVALLVWTRLAVHCPHAGAVSFGFASSVCPVLDAVFVPGLEIGELHLIPKQDVIGARGIVLVVRIDQWKHRAARRRPQ